MLQNPTFQLIVLQIIAHLLADYSLQPPHWSAVKRSKVFTMHHIYHVLVVFVCSLVFSFNYNFWPYALLLTLLHLLTDISKSYLQVRKNKMKTLRSSDYFFEDQFVHIIALVAISYYYSTQCNLNFIFEIPPKLSLIAAAVIFCLKPASIVIMNVFVKFSIERPTGINQDAVIETHFVDDVSEERISDEEARKDSNLQNAGRLIGVLERILVLALILNEQFTAVGLVIVAKAIFRFQSTQKKEYILVGTFLSVGMAVIWGVLILWLIK